MSFRQVPLVIGKRTDHCVLLLRTGFPRPNPNPNATIITLAVPDDGARTAHLAAEAGGGVAQIAVPPGASGLSLKCQVQSSPSKSMHSMHVEFDSPRACLLLRQRPFLDMNKVHNEEFRVLTTLKHSSRRLTGNIYTLYQLDD